MRRTLWVVVGSFFSLLGSAQLAHADDGVKLKQIGEWAASQPAPAPGFEKATPRVPPWCQGIDTSGSWDPLSIQRTIEAGRKDWPTFFKAAQPLCKFIKDPNAQKAAAVLEQEWINITGLSVAEAAETFGSRLRKDEDYAAEKAKFCDALTVSDEVEGEEKAFMVARRALWGCVPGSHGTKHPLWAETTKMPDDLIYFMDANATGVDELVRLAVIIDHSRFLWDKPRSAYFDRQILTYIFDQYDYLQFNRQSVMRVLDQAPYKGNWVARAILLESIGAAQQAVVEWKSVIDKKSKDADWKALLVDGPRAGIGAYEQEAAKYKAELQRSAEFEAKFWGPSKKAAKGCWPALKKDFVGIAKTFKHTNAQEFLEQLSDPITSLLFTRLAACAALDQDKNYAAKLNTLTTDMRNSRGPRIAGYYAAVDALSKILADRSKFPVTQKDLFFWKDSALYSRVLDIVNTGSQANEFQMGDGGKGVVKTAKKGPKGVEVTFQTETHQEMSRSCVETNHLIRFRLDGSPMWYMKCHDTGMITVNDTAPAVTIPNEWADGVAVGTAIEFFAMRGKAPARIAMPKAVYKDKAKKLLVNYYGIGL